MRLFYIVLLLATASPLLAQEEEVAGNQADSTMEGEPAEREPDDAGESDEDDADDSDLDQQTYDEPEDIFVPTEEIPSDQPIPFPSNI